MPIPRIEYTDDAFDVVIENLVLSGRNLFPNIIEVRANNYFKYSPYASAYHPSSIFVAVANSPRRH